MTTFEVSILQPASPFTQQQCNPFLHHCTLQWRRKQLLVCFSRQQQQPYLPAFENERSLVARLKRSPVKLVRIDPDLGEAGLSFWANACERANKAVFLRVPSTWELPKKRRPLSWWLKRQIDWSIAALLFLVLSPVMLGLTLLIRVNSPGSVFLRQWRVGERGKLFRVFKFRTTTAILMADQQQHHEAMGDQKDPYEYIEDTRLTRLGWWIQKYRLDKLPQLLNVLRGEMSLIGSRPWTLHDAVHICPKGQVKLNALPGIVGHCQIETKSTLLDLATVNSRDLEYFRSWSLSRDLKIMLMTLPKVFSGFGVY